MDAQFLETVRVQLARMKAENRNMLKWLRAKKLAFKWERKELQRIKTMNQRTIACNRNIQKLVEDFLVVVKAERNDPENAKIWSEKAITEVTEEMRTLDLYGNNHLTLNQGSGNSANDKN